MKKLKSYGELTGLKIGEGKSVMLVVRCLEKGCCSECCMEDTAGITTICFNSKTIKAIKKAQEKKS